MKLNIKKSLIDFILGEYDDKFDDWYGDYLPSFRAQKNIGKGMVEINVTEKAYKWLCFVIKDDSNGFGRLWDTYDERTPNEKRAITKFTKEAKEFLV